MEFQSARALLGTETGKLGVEEVDDVPQRGSGFDEVGMVRLWGEVSMG